MQPGLTQSPDPQLGHVVSVWRAGGKRFVLLCVAFVFLALVFGLVAVGLMQKEPVVGAVFAVIMLVFSVSMLLLLTGIRVVVYTHGIERSGRLRSKRLAWDQLESYTLLITDPAANAAAGGGLLAMLIIRALTSDKIAPQSVYLKSKDGTAISLPNHLKDYGTLVDSLVPYLTERLAANVHQDLMRGVPVRFGKRLALDPREGIVFTGFFGKRLTLPFSEVGSTGTERALFVIHKYGQASLGDA